MRADDGSATVAALIATLLVLGIATATWVVALDGFRQARAGHVGSQARAAAEAAVRLQASSAPVPPDLPLGTARSLGSLTVAPGLRAHTTMRRVGRELYLLEATGQHSPTTISSSIGFVVWSLHPTARLGAAGGVVTTAGAVSSGPTGGIQASALAAAPPGWSVPCAPLLPGIDSVAPGGQMPPVASDTTLMPRLGLLDAAWLSTHATTRVAGAVTPAPRSNAGTCTTTDPLNWGDPTGSGPCDQYRPTLYAPGNVVMNGGVGQGVLSVEGDLTLTSGARFFGVILTGGSVRIAGGARVWGLVMASGDVSIADGWIVGSGCAAMLAMSALPLGIPIPVPEGWADPL